MLRYRCRQPELRCFASAASFSAAVALSAVARADAALSLTYDAPAECPPESALRDAVENLVTRERARPFSARVTIGREAAAYRASIASADGSTRVLEGSTCSEVVEAASVVLALAIGPKGRSADKSSPKAAATKGSAAPASASAVSDGPRLVAGAAARGDIGALPHPALGFGGALGVERGWWSLRAKGTYFLDSRGRLPVDSKLGGDFSWWTGGAEGCAAPARGTLRLELCAGAELGRLSGQGRGVTSPEHPSTTWGALTGGVAASWSISTSLRLRAGLGAALTLLGRRPFVLDDIRVHQPALVAGRAELGPELLF